MSKILSEHDIPPLVRQHGKVTINWQPYDFETLHRLSRSGYSLNGIAAQLPALWWFHRELRVELLEQAIALDPLVQKSLHTNVGTGQHTPLEDGQTDLVLTDIELLEYQDVFSSLRHTLLELPKQEFERILGVLLEELTAVKTPKPTAAAKPTRATVANADRPKRKAGGGQNRCSEAEVDRRILQLCRSPKGESFAQIGKIISPLQNRAKESNQTLKQCTLQRVEGLAALGLGEVLGEGRNTRFRSFAIAAPQPSTAGLQLSRRLCSVA